MTAVGDFTAEKRSQSCSHAIVWAGCTRACRFEGLVRGLTVRSLWLLRQHSIASSQEGTQ